MELSSTPFHLFAFEFYRKFLVKDEAKKQGSYCGRGFKKAVHKWYHAKSGEELLKLLTEYRKSHGWSNKDFIKLFHIKPKDEGKSLFKIQSTW